MDKINKIEKVNIIHLKYKIDKVYNESIEKEKKIKRKNKKKRCKTNNAVIMTYDEILNYEF